MIHRKYEMSHGGILETYLQDSQITYKKYKKKPAMIICPGGAYLIHATKEGEPVAVEFMQAGFPVLCTLLFYWNRQGTSGEGNKSGGKISDPGSPTDGGNASAPRACRRMED